MKRGRIIIFMLAVCCLLAAFAACSAQPAGDAGSGGESSGTVAIVGNVDRKIVYSGNVRMQCEDVASASEALRQQCADEGGYTQTLREYGDEGGFTRIDVVLRIPTEKFETFLQSIGGQGKVLSRTVSSQDITTQYVDAEAKKQSLAESIASLEAILAEDGLSVSDRIDLVNTIADLNAELKSIELELSQYDSMLDYSTVEIRIERPDSYVGAIVGISIVGAVLIAFLVAVIVLSVKLFGAKKRVGSQPPRA